MAEHTIPKARGPEETGPRKKLNESVPERVKAQNQGPHPDGLEAFSLEDHIGLFGSAALSLSVNEAERACILSRVQQYCGNAYVQRLLRSRAIQTKLTVTPQADMFEREADQAGEVVADRAASELQRQEAEETARTKQAASRIESRLQSEEEGNIQTNKGPTPEEGGAGGFYYFAILKPMMEGLWEELQGKVEEHRYHLLALVCLRKAAGAGADPIELARFCKTYELPLTLPVVGLISRVVGKLDVTGATKMGVRIMGGMLPLLEKIRLRNAILYALDESVVPEPDLDSVGMILENAKSPRQVIEAAKQKASEVSRMKDEVLRYAAQMEKIEAELGVGKGASQRGATRQ